MPDQPPDRLEREINEILGRIDAFPGPRERRVRASRRQFRRVTERIARGQRAVVRELGRFSVSQLMLLSFLLILGSLFFRGINPLITEWVMVAGVVLFLASFALLVFGGWRPGGGSTTHYWRGRRIDPRADGTDGKRRPPRAR